MTQILTQIRSYIFLRLRNFTIDRRRFHLSQEDNSEPNVRLEQKVSMSELVTVQLQENTFIDTDYGRKMIQPFSAYGLCPESHDGTDTLSM